MSLPHGPHVAKGGLHCEGSISALGTSNVEGSGKASTVVNIWKLTTSSSTNAGYLIKAHDGSFWYESPIGMSYQRISQNDWPYIMTKSVTISGCFSSDLKL